MKKKTVKRQTSVRNLDFGSGTWTHVGSTKYPFDESHFPPKTIRVPSTDARARPTNESMRSKAFLSITADINTDPSRTYTFFSVFSPKKCKKIGLHLQLSPLRPNLWAPPQIWARGFSEQTVGSRHCTFGPGIRTQSGKWRQLPPPNGPTDGQSENSCLQVLNNFP
jgi:hypothetical protein